MQASTRLSPLQTGPRHSAGRRCRKPTCALTPVHCLRLSPLTAGLPPELPRGFSVCSLGTLLWVLLIGTKGIPLPDELELIKRCTTTRVHRMDEARGTIDLAPEKFVRCRVERTTIHSTAGEP